MSSLKFRHWLFLAGIALAIVGFFIIPWHWPAALFFTGVGCIVVAVVAILTPDVPE